MTSPNVKTVLYAEDDENDVYLMARAFEKLGVLHPLKTVEDGKLAISYLSGHEKYPEAGQTPPSLLLLDLSLGGKHGFDVLQWVRSQPRLAGMPVVVLTSSNQASDIHRAYLLGANGFFIKPGDPDELIQIVNAIQEYWLADERRRTGFVDISAFRGPAEKTRAIEGQDGNGHQSRKGSSSI